MKPISTCIIFAILLTACGSIHKTVTEAATQSEPHRPLIHFTPATAWMNDPNGMVFYNGTYHLFYQHYPDSTVWGPMHWGHATSRDLVHWRHLPIALYPDSLGYIFSGSAVVDSANTSGFGQADNVPLVAIFTHHEPKGEKSGRADFQYQSIAYSLDEGATWTKYAGNPVLKNPGIRDFRDPKVMWHAESKKWIMTLATMDRITFYSSPNLKDWTRESEFGKDAGAHGGVWECPDLFPMNYKGETVWVLLVSINPGGPNGGSATQYFTGRFDGHSFTPFATDTRWVDYGPDDYAGVTWSNTGDRKIFLGWMSSWPYADKVPTKNWRSAMTIPKDLSLEKVGENYLLRSVPSPELNALAERPVRLKNTDGAHIDLTKQTGQLAGAARVQLQTDSLADFSFTLSNGANEKVVIGYEKKGNSYFIDRRTSGKTSFEKSFAKKLTAPRLTNKAGIDLTLIIDNASVELFADGGLTVMTSVFFPNSPFVNLTLQAEGAAVRSLQYNKLKTVFQPASVASLPK